ncbi:probable pectinesterase/pectinesterase inhibitor 46 [Ricinus communis]|uniref:Pectinesterase n=1 Tax=Ricinus communis TaxID=3988 RepID=B9RPW2_RICCO|nr:probable pectinesterase/pectinesterase inhibitor 46 [Ricinus communis]EEF46620.1 Pectinesterase-3 precursor, putative [Ricinus communis]|eukprot:XP_002515781.1 probable pectinesterase/pectinesterase inhibitor 46 [Ricinus communis]
MSSFKAYGKVDEAEQATLEARRRTRKRITIISLSSILLAAIVVAAVVGTHASGGNSNNGGDQAKPISTSVKAVCDVTLYKDSCYSSLAPFAKPNNLQPEELFKLSIQVALDEISKASQYFINNGQFLGGLNDNNMINAALKDCQDLLDLAIDRLNSSLSSANDVSLIDVADDFRSWLSAAGSYQQTCIDGLKEANLKSTAQNYYLKNTTELTSNSLAIITWIYKIASSVKMRRLMSYAEHDKVNLPRWLHQNDRKLLQSNDLKKKANAVVAKDGSGKYKTISDALKAVPDKSKKRFIIYVKKGIYTENVRVEKPKWNVVIVGDGMNATIVSGSLNFVDGTPTFSTATFAVFGKGFIARDMGFRNTAGPIKHQAVALMSTADMSVFYRCSFDAFQDTLYAHSNRQFYRECNIYGTVDFIFGNSAVVIQNCNILPRRTMPGQKNTITAQGRFDPNQNTGISIQNCTILPFDNLTSIQTFLGRPWKNYSTTVYMHSMMGSLIDPSGWLPWTGNTAPPTIFYAEFQNFGPGSSTKNRVKWKGLKNITYKLASKFTANAFLQGDKWIPESGVSYKPGL